MLESIEDEIERVQIVRNLRNTEGESMKEAAEDENHEEVLGYLSKMTGEERGGFC